MLPADRAGVGARRPPVGVPPTVRPAALPHPDTLLPALQNTAQHLQNSKYHTVRKYAQSRIFNRMGK